MPAAPVATAPEPAIAGPATATAAAAEANAPVFLPPATAAASFANPTASGVFTACSARFLSVLRADDGWGATAAFGRVRDPFWGLPQRRIWSLGAPALRDWYFWRVWNSALLLLFRPGWAEGWGHVQEGMGTRGLGTWPGKEIHVANGAYYAQLRSNLFQ